MPPPPWVEREHDWLAPFSEIGKALLPVGGTPSAALWGMSTTPAAVLEQRAEIEDIGRTWGAP